MKKKKEPENIVTPKIAKMIDELSKEPLSEIDSTLENIERLFEKVADEMAERMIESDKRPIYVNLNGKLTKI